MKNHEAFFILNRQENFRYTETKNNVLYRYTNADLKISLYVRIHCRPTGWLYSLGRMRNSS